jgi:hypothetical protein
MRAVFASAVRLQHIRGATNGVFALDKAGFQVVSLVERLLRPYVLRTLVLPGVLAIMAINSDLSSSQASSKVGLKSRVSMASN